MVLCGVTLKHASAFYKAELQMGNFTWRRKTTVLLWISRQNSRKKIHSGVDKKVKKSLTGIKKLKEGDPNDMIVTLLREMLIEMEATFKASNSKKKLVEKVIKERSRANCTSTASDTRLTTSHPASSTTSSTPLSSTT